MPWVSVKDLNGFVATPDELADHLVRTHLDLDAVEQPSVVEPSAGRGSLVRAVLRAVPDAKVTAVEPYDEHASHLDELPVAVVRSTLEEFADGGTQDGVHDAVVMNPPFALHDNHRAWMDHLYLAMRLVKPGGQLVAILPASYAFRVDRWHVAARDRVAKWGGELFPLPKNVFASAGTGIDTVAIVARRPHEATDLPALRPAKKKRWRDMTDEEKQQHTKSRRKADNALRDRADLALDDEDFVASMEQRLRELPPDCKLRTYSPRNQALVLIQAADAGVEVSGHLKTFVSWKKEGRGIVAGQLSMRIVAPMGDWADRQRGDGAAGSGGGEGAAPLPPVQEAARPEGEQPSAPEDGGRGMPKFKMESVFDFNQTEKKQPREVTGK